MCLSSLFCLSCCDTQLFCFLLWCGLLFLLRLSAYGPSHAYHRLLICVQAFFFRMQSQSSTVYGAEACPLPVTTEMPIMMLLVPHEDPIICLVICAAFVCHVCMRIWHTHCSHQITFHNSCHGNDAARRPVYPETFLILA